MPYTESWPPKVTWFHVQSTNLSLAPVTMSQAARFARPSCTRKLGSVSYSIGLHLDLDVGVLVVPDLGHLLDPGDPGGEVERDLSGGRRAGVGGGVTGRGVVAAGGAAGQSYY
jgi:hypothetical protein